MYRVTCHPFKTCLICQGCCTAFLASAPDRTNREWSELTAWELEHSLQHTTTSTFHGFIIANQQTDRSRWNYALFSPKPREDVSSPHHSQRCFDFIIKCLCVNLRYGAHALHRPAQAKQTLHKSLKGYSTVFIQQQNASLSKKKAAYIEIRLVRVQTQPLEQKTSKRRNLPFINWSNELEKMAWRKVQEGTELCAANTDVTKMTESSSN